MIIALYLYVTIFLIRSSKKISKEMSKIYKIVIMKLTV